MAPNMVRKIVAAQIEAGKTQESRVRGHGDPHKHHEVPLAAVQGPRDLGHAHQTQLGWLPG